MDACAYDEGADRPRRSHQWAGGSQPSSTGGFQFSPTVRLSSTQGPSSGCANFVCFSFRRIP